MNKKIQKPFSVEAWKNGAKVETRFGYAVRILCTDANITSGRYKRPIVGIVKTEQGEYTEEWAVDGRYEGPESDVNDLIIVEEVEEPEHWADDKEAIGEGWYIGCYCHIKHGTFSVNDEAHYDVFATEKQAKAALAMARISQIMVHDKRYGGVVTDEEWKNRNIYKFCIARYQTFYEYVEYENAYYFLAFHTEEQRELFLKENERLVKDYLMIE